MMNSSAAVACLWEDRLLVGHEQMDEEHQSFALLIAALQKAPDHALDACLAELIAHATHHFAQEDAWMCKLNFPARQCHMDEHAAVLRSAGGVRLRVHGGDYQSARLFSKELAAWFPPHVQHLDSALASWICKLAWNAKPLVFHRQSRARVATATA
ncbi:MAG: hemerythrin-like metal-binding protein [Polaromonas sp.]|nr:hemerythrin-like metal-binding protein [Polaromonas sp.]